MPLTAACPTSARATSGKENLQLPVYTQGAPRPGRHKIQIWSPALPPPNLTKGFPTTLHYDGRARQPVQAGCEGTQPRSSTSRRLGEPWQTSLRPTAALSCVPPTFCPDKFPLHFWTFLSAPWSTRSHSHNVSQTACRFLSRRRHYPARGVHSGAVSHTWGERTKSAPRVAALEEHFHSLHFHRVTLAKDGEHWGKPGLARLGRRLLSTSLSDTEVAGLQGSATPLNIHQSSNNKGKLGKGKRSCGVPSSLWIPLHNEVISNRP